MDEVIDRLLRQIQADAAELKRDTGQVRQGASEIKGMTREIKTELQDMTNSENSSSQPGTTLKLN